MSSSEEDFSLVMDPLCGDSLAEIKDLTINYQKKHELLMEEQKELVVSRDECREYTKQFRQRRDKLTQLKKDDELTHNEEMKGEQEMLDRLSLQEIELREEIQRMKAALREKEAQNERLRQQTDVFKAVPERKLAFQEVSENPTNPLAFDMKPHIVYPMEGGTALITFDDPAVAKKIVVLKQHQVELGGDCCIEVEARTVQLMLPRLVEIDTDVCPQRILISNLPPMDSETLLNKLEIHFSKSRNGGGEVEDCEALPDSGTVVLTFIRNDIAKGLTESEYHEVKLQKKHRVRVTPFLNGKITNLKTKMVACPRTVLLTGIPAVMERETLQDHLEIHFQKSGKDGGEIEAILYNPPGQSLLALFGSPKTQKDA